MRELVTAAGAAKAIGPYSPALKVGNLLFLSGSIPLDPVSGQIVAGEITEQAKRVMENIKALLAAANWGFFDTGDRTFPRLVGAFSARPACNSCHFVVTVLPFPVSGRPR